MAIVFGAMACIGLSQNPADVEQTFGSFLSAVAAFDRSATSRPTPREVIGLTETEAQFLNAVAAEWESRNRSFSGIERALRREALFQSIEAEELPAKVVEKRAKDLVQQIAEVRQQRDQLIHDQVQRLRESFGAERFPVVEAFVRAKAPDSSFFPLPGGAHATAKKAQ